MIPVSAVSPIAKHDPKKASTRLFFCKESRLSRIWHIVDAALAYGQPDRTVKYQPLHGGQPLHSEVQVDTVLQLDLIRGTDGVCERCLQEFELAAAVIEEKEMLKFE